MLTRAVHEIIFFFNIQGRPKPKAAEARALGLQNILIFLKPNRPQKFTFE
jgi:hypothetical protein